MTPEEKEAVLHMMAEKLIDQCPECRDNNFGVMGRCTINPDGAGEITCVQIMCAYCGCVMTNVEAVLMAPQ